MLNLNLEALYKERDRLKSELDKVEKDIEHLVAISGFPISYIIDGKEVTLKIEQLGADWCEVIRRK